MQAVSWIKSKESKNQLKIMTFNQSDYMKQLEMALQFGNPVLFENISTEIDPLLDNVLEKNVVSEAGVEWM
jgi:dynein heavy chain